MPVEIKQLSELDPDNVTTQAELCAEMVQEDNPRIDAKRGILRDVLIQYGAALKEVAAEEIRRYNRGRSLKEITEDPVNAPEDLVDSVLSMYRITRREGSQSVGTVTIVLNRAINVTIRAGAVFTGNGKEFVTERVFTSQATSATATSDTDQVLTQLDADRWGFDIEVVAVEAGADSRLLKDTVLIPSEEPLAFVKAYAAADFVGGSATESNAEMVERLNRGLAAKGGSNRYNMDAMLAEQPAFANIVDTSIIGFGDAEQLRNHTIWPGQLGGRVDWYVRTQDKPQFKQLTVTATLISKGSDNRGTWQFAIAKEDAPGFFDVVKILPVDSDETLGGYPVTSETRGFDLSDEEFVPDVANAVEAAYTPLQTAVIRFYDEDADTSDMSVGDEVDYSVTVRMLPLLRDLQDFVNGQRVRHAAADVLIKAPVPCFVQVSFEVQLKNGQTEPDLDAIKNALAAKVNGYGFTGRLPASALHAVIQSHLEAPAAASALDLFGVIRRPDQTIKPLRSSEVLLIPDEPAKMVTARTVAFFLDPADVAITVKYVDMPEI